MNDSVPVDSTSGLKFDQILSEQDRGLDSLHNVIVRSRITAQNIETEVGVQNEIIDDLGKTFLRAIKITRLMRKLANTRTHPFSQTYFTCFICLDNDVERTTQHLLSTTQRVRTVDRTSAGVWKYWLVIAILFIVIVVIIVIP